MTPTISQIVFRCINGIMYPQIVNMEIRLVAAKNPSVHTTKCHHVVELVKQMSQIPVSLVIKRPGVNR